MQAQWNKLAVDRPPETSWHCAANEFDSTGFLRVVNKAIRELERNTIFETEAAMLSRLIYRMKSKLRSDKGLKNMEKVNRALLNYLKLSLEKDYVCLKESVESSGSIHALPSRQMLQHALVRTQGFAKLMCRIESVAGFAAEFFKARISLGQAWNISVVAYAVISRIWLLSRYLTKRCCEWYNRLYKYLNKLQLVGVRWLPEDHQFPEDLKMWLCVSWINDDLKNFPSKDGLTDSIFNLITQHQDAEEDRELDLKQTEDNFVPAPLTVTKSAEISVVMTKTDGTKMALQKCIERIPSSREEVGERISRDSFIADSSEGTSRMQLTKRVIVEAENMDDIGEIRSKRRTKIDRQKGTKRNAMSVDEIGTKEDVIKFISSESYPGLDKLQWKMLRKNVNKLLMKFKKYEDSSNTKKEEMLLKKAIQSIREWIN